MSKTTASLLILFILFIGVLLVIVFAYKQNPIITSLTKPIVTETALPSTSLSFANDSQTIHRGQTVTVSVLIHNPDPHPAVAQLEIAYDPTAVTIDSINPGSFFTRPVIALQNVDPVAGRISYALRCPDMPTSGVNDCVNTTSLTVATITLNINTYSASSSTSLSFLPKTIIRTSLGKDLLEKTSNLQLAITSPLLQIASSSALASPAANLTNIQPIQ